ncbi:hypothetical protein ACM66B_005594 [Microbotryomycetes sp. NB124-2]
MSGSDPSLAIQKAQSPSSTRSHSLTPSQSTLNKRTFTATPQFEPPPPDSKRVRWGSNELYSQQAYSASATTNGGTSKAGSSLRQSQFVEQDEFGEEHDAHESGWNSQGKEVVLAITSLNGKVGCCCYDGQTGRLTLLPDQSETENWDVTRMILQQTLPQRVSTSSKADATFLVQLESILSSIPSTSDLSVTTSATGSDSDGSKPVRLEMRPAREFYAGQGKEALSNLNVLEGGIYELEDDDQDWNDGGFNLRAGKQGEQIKMMRELRLESFVNGLTSSPLTLGCAGALVSQVSRSMSAAGEMIDPEEGLAVTALDWIQLDDVMQINWDALTSLQIFVDESHAAMHSSATKEGLSLFAILNNTKTPAGLIMMRHWLIRPSLDLDIIQGRQAAVFSYGAIMIRDATLNLSYRRGVPVLEKFLTLVDPDRIRDLGERINDLIDWKESQLELNSVHVKPGVDRELDELRRQLAGLPSLLSRCASEIVKDVPLELTGLIDALSVVYFPQLGYLINTPFNDYMLDDEIQRQLEWDFHFLTEDFAYFKNQKCRDLDFHLGDIRSFIQGREIDILRELVHHVAAHEELIVRTTQVLAELDCLMSFAEAARLNNWTQPEMCPEPICLIRNGRHPLVQLCVDTCVPNDCVLAAGHGLPSEADEEKEFDLEDDKDRDDKPEVDEDEEGYLRDDLSMMLVTGANYSGKSVYLKQVALITYMAHLGSFVPADAATIGLTDRILTRVSTRESAAKPASAFMIDLQQISFMLRSATSRSLLIIDEFGKGTEAEDGASLFCGVIEHLMRRGEHTPRILAATHFHHILSNNLLSADLPIGFAHMEILIHDSGVKAKSEKSSSDMGPAFADLTYLYRVAPGTASTSHALTCAALFGIPSRVLDRAQFVTNALSTFDMDSVVNETLDDNETRASAFIDERDRKEVEQCEMVAKRLIDWDLDDEEWADEDVQVSKIRTKLADILNSETPPSEVD